MKKVLQKDHMSYHMGSVLIHKSLFNIVGNFSDTFGNDNDSADWIFRSKDLGFIGGEIREVLLHRRVHDDNLSGEVNTQNATLLKALKVSIERQKKENE